MFSSFSYKFNYLKKLNNLRNSIVMNNILANNNFIIFCDINKIKNFKLLNLRNEIKKLNCKSLISNHRFIKLGNTIFDLKFLGTHILMIFTLSFELFFKLLFLLHNEGILYFFLYFNYLSCFRNFNDLFLYQKNLTILFNLNFLIYKLIIKIFLILSIFIRFIFILVSNK